MLKQIANTPEEAIAIRDRYIRDPEGFLEDIVGMALDTWQRELCQAILIHDRIAVSSGHGSGKALSDSTVIPTPCGDVPMGDLMVGDYVFGKNGEPAAITAVFPQGVRPIYKITLNDHTEIFTDRDHQWQVSSRNERRNNLPDIVLTTGEMIDRGVKRKNGKNTARVFKLPKSNAVRFDENNRWGYALGVWIGDGHAGQGTYCKPYHEIKDHLISSGIKVLTQKDGVTHTISGLSPLLRSCDLIKTRSYERFIPKQFFTYDIDARSELLRGLLDTDGECSKNHEIIYSTTSKQLVKDVLKLVRSLGGKASLNPTPKIGKYKKDGEYVICRDCYRISIAMPDEFRCFYIKHKNKRVKKNRIQVLSRYVESIEYSHDELATCITVDAVDNLFLCNDYVVTHNTAITAGLNQWFIAVHPDPYIVCTANTKQQLSEKTWRELAKWHQKSLVKDWFEWTATQFRHVDSPATWFATAVPQTEHNSEAFAGVHEKYILQIFDEASKIPAIIFDVAEGATATKGGYRKWIIFGNPTQNTGGFYDACFGKMKHRWHQIILDTRTCKYADQKQIKDWEEDHGVDSDFFRVRVRGLPPQQSITNLIGTKLAEAAAKRELPAKDYDFAPKILSIDTARFGDDDTVFSYRQGLKLHWQRSFHGLDEVQIATEAIRCIEDINPDATLMDLTGGYGAGAHDIMKNLGHRVVSVNYASTDGIDDQYQNMRISMWDLTREWLANADIPDDPDLIRDLTTPEYFYNRSSGKKQLESKEDLKARLGRSPDKADSLVTGFAYPVRKQYHQPPPQEPVNWRAV